MISPQEKIMSSIGNSSESSSDLISVRSRENLVPKTPISSPPLSPKLAKKIRNKTMPTKTMVNQAVEALSENSRKGFSLASIRKYIQQHYLATELELKPRMRYIKKFVRDALKNGQLTHVKGTGLTGSFRKPSKKATKSDRLSKQRQGKPSTKRTKQAGEKRQQKAEKPLKKRKIIYSAVL